MKLKDIRDNDLLIGQLIANPHRHSVDAIDDLRET